MTHLRSVSQLVCLSVYLFVPYHSELYREARCT